jgi:hypothetical protein
MQFDLADTTKNTTIRDFAANVAAWQRKSGRAS